MNRLAQYAYVLVLGLSLLPATGWQAFAADTGTPGQSQSTDQNSTEGRHERHEWCKNNPEKCKEKREEWCKNNPEKCKAHQERREQWCKDHPDSCHKKDGDSNSNSNPSSAPNSDSGAPSQAPKE